MTKQELEKLYYEDQTAYTFIAMLINLRHEQLKEAEIIRKESEHENIKK